MEDYIYRIDAGEGTNGEFHNLFPIINVEIEVLAKQISIRGWDGVEVVRVVDWYLLAAWHDVRYADGFSRHRIYAVSGRDWYCYDIELSQWRRKRSADLTWQWLGESRLSEIPVGICKIISQYYLTTGANG